MLSIENKHHRTLFILLAAIISYLIFNTTERCFSKADRRNAITMVKTLKANDQTLSIPQIFQKIHPNVNPNAIKWSAILTDNCYGFVNVTATLPSQNTNIIKYKFSVNLTGNRLHPANENARLLMKDIQAGKFKIKNSSGI